MSKAADGWSKDERGSVILNPLIGYQVRVMKAGPGNACLLRLEYIEAPDPETSELALQLAMTSGQVRELARALLQTADAADGRISTTVN